MAGLALCPGDAAGAGGHGGRGSGGGGAGLSQGQGGRLWSFSACVTPEGRGRVPQCAGDSERRGLALGIVSCDAGRGHAGHHTSSSRWVPAGGPHNISEDSTVPPPKFCECWTRT